MFKEGLEISSIDDPLPHAVNTPCFGGANEDLALKPANESGSRSCLTLESDISKFSYPKRNWAITYIQFLCFSMLVMGVHIPEASPSGLLLTLPYVYDIFICDRYLNRYKLPIPIGSAFSYSSEDREMKGKEILQRICESIEKSVKSAIFKIKLFRHLCTVCLFMSMIGVILVSVFKIINIKYWQILTILAIVPVGVLFFYTYSIKSILKKLDSSARAICKANRDGLIAENINVDVGMNCVYMYFTKE